MTEAAQQFLFEADSQDGAHQIVEADPAVDVGVMSATLYPPPVDVQRDSH
ncbi:MAG: hypothetical protein VX733_09480 [Candidatus Latescibacterota bacterium]|nr:hypothetical protein [Candidatus Latescibacterota bacterium]